MKDLFGERLEQCLHTLMRVARRQFGLDDEEARDLVQEVVVDWLDFAARTGVESGCSSGEHLHSTLHRMLVQRGIDRLRRFERRNRPMSDDIQDERVLDDLCKLISQQDAIQREVKRLPQVRRSALRLLYVDGFTQDEIADRMNIDRRLVSAWKRDLERRLLSREEER